jgi:hypothetical protein
MANRQLCRGVTDHQRPMNSAPQTLESLERISEDFERRNSGPRVV